MCIKYLSSSVTNLNMKRIEYLTIRIKDPVLRNKKQLQALKHFLRCTFFSVSVNWGSISREEEEFARKCKTLQWNYLNNVQVQIWESCTRIVCFKDKIFLEFKCLEFFQNRIYQRAKFQDAPWQLTEWSCHCRWWFFTECMRVPREGMWLVERKR